jgi:hypothetical protein
MSEKEENKIKGTGDGHVKTMIKKAPAAAKKWWMPLAIAALGVITTLGQSAISEFKEGRDSRDEDIIKLQKTTEAQWKLIGQLRERIAFLEGAAHLPRSFEPFVPPVIKVDEKDLEIYQESKK